MTKEHSVCRALVHVSEMIITRQNQDTRSIYELMQFGVTGSGVCELGELVSQQAYGRIVHEVTPTQKNDRILLATLLDLSKCDCIVRDTLNKSAMMWHSKHKRPDTEWG